MSTGMKMAMRTYVMYLANALLCGLFVLWFSWTWLQTLLAIALLVGFGMMCYNEGGWNGERDCTLERTAQKRIAEGKSVDEEMKSHTFNKKHALVCFLASSIPLFLLATVNLIASPNYPVPERPAVVEQQAEEENVDPFAYNAEEVQQRAEQAEVVSQEPSWQFTLRLITRIMFIPLLPLYTLLAYQPVILYAIFVPFAFVLPACTAIGYLRGPKIREKKIEEIARGKVRKKRGLLVGGIPTQNQAARVPKQPKPKV